MFGGIEREANKLRGNQTYFGGLLLFAIQGLTSIGHQWFDRICPGIPVAFGRGRPYLPKDDLDSGRFFREPSLCWVRKLMILVSAGNLQQGADGFLRFLSLA